MSTVERNVMAKRLAEQEPQLSQITLRAGAFSYIALGDENAPLILLAHGFPDCPYSFVPLMRELVRAGYRVAAPYMRGYAPSPLEGPFNTQRIGDDFAELADALSPNNSCVLVGHDWGAAAAYTALGRWPHRFRKAVAMSVPHLAAFARNLRKSRVQQKRSAYIPLLMTPFVGERVVAYDDYAYVAHLWRTWSPGLTPDPVLLEVIKASLRESLPAPLLYYRSLFPTPDQRRQARLDSRIRIHVPLLYLHGDNDGCVGYEISEGQESCFAAGFRSELVPNAGHFLHVEQPAEIAARILAWLE